VREVLVLAPGRIPTVDLYFRERLKALFGEAVRYVDVLKISPHEVTLGRDLLVVVVRHAPLGWLRWLEGQPSRIAGVAFFMDDDIPGAAGASELPLRYGVKTAWRYALNRRILGRLCSDIWVSTSTLAGRYSRSSPKLWEPEYVGSEPIDEATAVYFYHGSWAHRREIEWLVPVIRQVQEAVPNAFFEIMGTDRVRRLYRGIPRVRVVHPMPWKDYLAHTGSVRYQVGLAPCFDTNFNRARSHSKVFDITRLGAAGIYSNSTPYAEKVTHGRTGWLCENVADKWVEALTLLLKNRDLRTSLYSEARAWCADRGKDKCRHQRFLLDPFSSAPSMGPHDTDASIDTP
jgi:glycosyltransferase involved in cell wall biosynthesis